MALFAWSRPWGRRALGSPHRSAELGGGPPYTAGTASSATRGWSPCLAGDSDGALTERGCAQWGCLGHAESSPPGEKGLHSINNVKTPMSQNSHAQGLSSLHSFYMLYIHTFESLSLSQPEPMMNATSCPSSNQPSDSSGHWPRKLSTSSRVSGHSPDTETNAAGWKEPVHTVGHVLGVIKKKIRRSVQDERNVLSFKLKTGTKLILNIQNSI